MKKEVLICLLCLTVVLTACGKSEEIIAEQQYQECYDSTVYKMSETIVIAEEMCNLTLSVWHNSIYKIEDEETDVYTRNKKGVYFEDFNEALNNLVNSDEYQNMIFAFKKMLMK